MKALIILLFGLVQFSSCAYYLHRYSSSEFCTDYYQKEYLEIVPNQNQCWQNTTNAFYGTRAERIEISWPTILSNSTFMNLRYCTDRNFGDTCCGDLASSISVPYDECTILFGFAFKITNEFVENADYGGTITGGIIIDVIYTIFTIFMIFYVKIMDTKMDTWQYIGFSIACPALFVAAAAVSFFRVFNTPYHAGMEFLSLVLVRIIFGFDLKRIPNANARWIVKLIVACLMYANYVVLFLYVPDDAYFYAYLLCVKCALFLNVSMQIMENNEKVDVVFPSRFSRMHTIGDLFLAIYTIFMLIYHIYADLITTGMSLSNNAIVFQAAGYYIILSIVLFETDLGNRVPYYVFNGFNTLMVILCPISIFDYVTDYGKYVAVVAVILALLWVIGYITMIELWVKSVIYGDDEEGEENEEKPEKSGKNDVEQIEIKNSEEREKNRQDVNDEKKEKQTEREEKQKQEKENQKKEEENNSTSDDVKAGAD